MLGYKEQRLVHMFTGLMRQLVQKDFLTTPPVLLSRTVLHCIIYKILFLLHLSVWYFISEITAWISMKFDIGVIYTELSDKFNLYELFQ